MLSWLKNLLFTVEDLGRSHAVRGDFPNARHGIRNYPEVTTAVTSEEAGQTTGLQETGHG